jgi:hypothetical protein
MVHVQFITALAGSCLDGCLEKPLNRQDHQDTLLHDNIMLMKQQALQALQSCPCNKHCTTDQ